MGQCSSPPAEPDVTASVSVQEYERLAVYRATVCRGQRDVCPCIDPSCTGDIVVLEPSHLYQQHIKVLLGCKACEGTVGVKSGRYVPEVKAPGTEPSSRSRGRGFIGMLLVMAALVGGGITQQGVDMIQILGHGAPPLGADVVERCKESIFSTVEVMLEESMQKCVSFPCLV